MKPTELSDPSTALINALCNPKLFDQSRGVQLIETHISWVLLTGKYAYKIKKPVNFGFLDFSSLAKRKFCCEEELRLNRRLAESLYLEVVTITGTPEHPCLQSSGPVLEYAVKMLQFEAGALLSERADAGNLSTGEIDQLAEIVSRFHQQASPASKESEYGNARDIQHWMLENFAHIEPVLTDPEELARLNALKQWTLAEWQQLSGIMSERKRQGFVRECHGDLHLGNMTLIDGNVVPFDCIEFNPQLRWLDVMSEIAFIIMDLSYRGYKALGYRMLNRYLQQTGDYQGLPLLRYYLVYRALVRAKVALLTGLQQHNGLDVKHREEYSNFINLGQNITQYSHPFLMITHGYSGSGKSTGAQRVSETLGAICLRSDVERKRLYGFQAHEDTGSAAGAGIYSAQAGRRTYRHLAALARLILQAGYHVMVDATFLQAKQRQYFQKLAETTGAGYLILDCRAPEQELQARIDNRLKQDFEPSEATLEVLQQQVRAAEDLSVIEMEKAVIFDADSLARFNEFMSKMMIKMSSCKAGESI